MQTKTLIYLKANSWRGFMKGVYHSVYTFFRYGPDDLISSFTRPPILSSSTPPRLRCTSVVLHWCDPHAYMRTVISLPFVLCLQWIPLCLLPLNHDVFLLGFFFIACVCPCVCEGDRLKEKIKQSESNSRWMAVPLYRPPCEASFLHNILVRIRLSPLYVFYDVLFVDVM